MASLGILIGGWDLITIQDELLNANLIGLDFDLFNQVELVTLLEDLCRLLSLAYLTNRPVIL